VTHPRLKSSVTETVSAIRSYAGLQPNWDGQGAQPVTEATTARAVDTLRAMVERARPLHADLPIPIVGPTPGGSIHLQWTLSRGYVGVECPPPPEPLSFYAEIDGREIESDATSLDDLWETVRGAFV